MLSTCRRFSFLCEDSCSSDYAEPRILHRFHPPSSRLERAVQRCKSCIRSCPCCGRIVFGACSGDSISGPSYCLCSLAGWQGRGGFAGRGTRRPPRRQSQFLHWRGSKESCQRQFQPYPRTTLLWRLRGGSLHFQTWLARCPTCSQSRCTSNAILRLLGSFPRASSQG